MARSPGLEQQDGMFAVLGQPGGHSAAGGPRAHHDEVIRGAVARRRKEQPGDAPLHHVGQVDVGTQERVEEAKHEEGAQDRFHGASLSLELKMCTHDAPHHASFIAFLHGVI